MLLVTCFVSWHIFALLFLNIWHYRLSIGSVWETVTRGTPVSNSRPRRWNVPWIPHRRRIWSVCPSVGQQWRSGDWCVSPTTIWATGSHRSLWQRRRRRETSRRARLWRQRTLLVVSTTGVSSLARLCYFIPALNDVITQSRSGFHLYVGTRPTF